MGQRDVGPLTMKVQAGCGLAFSPEPQFVQEGRTFLDGARVHGLPQSKTAPARVVEMAILPPWRLTSRI